MFGMINVVTYDGCDAYVMKFIEDGEKLGETYRVTEAAKERIEKYCSNGGMEVLKYEFLYTVSLANVVAFKDYGDDEQKAAVDRFERMHFNYLY